MHSEMKTYKYLGAIINSLLKDNCHIRVHLTEKSNKLETYIRYTLGNNLAIKHNPLGGTVWEKTVMPALTHGSSVWFKNTIKASTSLQAF